MLHCFLIQQHNARFGKRADGEFPVTRVSDLANNKNIQRPAEVTRDFSGHYNAAARQSQDNIGLHSALSQMSAQFLTRFLS
jgi:hypothetical protein